MNEIHPFHGPLAEKMEARGYLPAGVVAQRCGVTVTTVYDWLNTGKVLGERAMGRYWFVDVDSLCRHLGAGVAVALGFGAVPPEPVRPA